MSRFKRSDEYNETDSETAETSEKPAEPVGTPEQLTAAVRYLAARIGGAAATEIDFLLGIPAPPASL